MSGELSGHLALVALTGRRLHGQECPLCRNAQRKIEARIIEPKDVWRHRPQHCYTCGKSPVGRFPDGSPLYHCNHGPVTQ